MDILVKIIVSFFISLSFGVILEAPKKFLMHISIIGAAGRLIYIIFERTHTVVLATFIATLIIALSSHTLARIFKAPVTIFLIAGILPLVPGMGMYQIVEYFLKSENTLALNAALSTFLTAGAIALAVFIMDSFFKVLKMNVKHIK